nr:RNA-directed DNA polymerase, eukaryota [Tanacetum cinerariifolium]
MGLSIVDVLQIETVVADTKNGGWKRRWVVRRHCMSINIQKSHLLGIGIPDNCVAEAAKPIGCSIMKAPFKYLGILVGDNMSSIKAWDETISKMKKRLSRWKLNTLSVGGRLTLLKSVLGSTPTTTCRFSRFPNLSLI